MPPTDFCGVLGRITVPSSIKIGDSFKEHSIISSLYYGHPTKFCTSKLPPFPIRQDPIFILTHLSDKSHSLVAPSNRVRLSQRIIYSANDSRFTGANSAGSSNMKSYEVAETSLSASSSYHPSIYLALNSNLVVINFVFVLFPI